MTWIQIAIERGAQVLIRKGNNPIQATLRFSKECHADDITAIGKDIKEALDNLEQMVADDAATEYLEIELSKESK